MWKTVISFYLGYTNIKKWKLSDCKQKTSSSVCVIKYNISGFVWKEWERFLLLYCLRWNAYVVKTC